MGAGSRAPVNRRWLSSESGEHEDREILKTANDPRNRPLTEQAGVPVPRSGVTPGLNHKKSSPVVQIQRQYLKRRTETSPQRSPE